MNPRPTEKNQNVRGKTKTQKNDVNAVKRTQNKGTRPSRLARAEETLQHSDLLWRTVFSEANDAILLLDEQYNIIECNQRACQMYGFTRLEMVGLNLRQLRSPETRESAQPQMEDAMRRGGLLWETIHQRKDGTLLPVEVSTKSLEIEGRLEFVHIVRDITRRKQAEEASRTAEEFLHTVLNNAPITIYAVDREGIFRLSEGKGLERAGLKPGENVGVSVLDLYDSLKVTLPDGHVITGREVIERVMSGETLAGITELNKVIYDNQFVPLLDSSGQVVGLVGVATDITDRKQAEEILRESETRQRLAIEHSHLILAQCDLDLRYIWIRNPHPDFDPERVIGMRDIELAENEGTRQLMQLKQQVIDTGKSLRLDIDFPLSDGSRTYDVLAEPLRDAAGAVVGVTTSSLDITERVKDREMLEKAHTQLRSLTARLNEVEENERRSLARELHDRVGQTLSALNINLNIMREQISGESARRVGSRIEDSIHLVDEAVTNMRNVMADLHPPVLDDYGLAAALRWYADRLSKRIGIPVRVEEAWGTGIRLSPRLETVLFRITQEASTNAALHAGAEQVIIRLESHEELVRMTVEDNGRGFDPDAVMGHGSHSGWGLRTMRERIESVGGRFRLDSAPGHGTRIIAEIDPGTEVPE